jgi:hypothetical protein
MIDDPIDYVLTLRGQALTLELRVKQLERELARLNGAAEHLHHYARSVDKAPNVEQWQLVCEQIAEMVSQHGSADADGRG